MFNNIIVMIKLFITKRYTFNNKILDKYQSKAVFCNYKNYLVVAGAGSGKTLTIAAKVKYLIDNNVDPKSILCLSFTNETVNSLKKTLIDNNIFVDVKTFHKLSLMILNNKYKISSNNLLEYTTEEYFYSLVYFDNTYKLLAYIDNLDVLKNTVVTFINNMKALNYDESFIINLLNSSIPIDNKITLVFILKIYLIYKEELLSENKIDFNDMINLAVSEIDNMDRFNYKYLIIDEYQDISVNRYNLIKKISMKYDTSIIAVGDDYQSIYSFSGSKVSLFTSYKKCFNKSKILKLKNTYRNPYDIVEISKRFVMKNKNQLNKRLKSSIYVKNPINVIYCKDYVRDINTIIRDLDNILILGRNNKDIDEVKDKINVDNKNIRFLTVHRSKGLESDNVIILNVVDDILGFPNKIIDNKVLKYLRVNNNLEEERRLFYVALTRCKKKVFILTKKNKESTFIKEILHDFKYKIKIIDLDKKTLNNH